MGRKNRKPANDKELKEVQWLRRENQKLRKNIASLRKQLSRIDVDRYQHVCEILEEYDNEPETFDPKEKLETLKKRWECHDCKEGILKLIMVSKLGEPYYFRKCTSCSKKTKLKKYTEDVEGITDELDN